MYAAVHFILQFINDMYSNLGAWPWAFIPYWREYSGAYALFNERGAYLFEEFAIDTYGSYSINFIVYNS